MRLNILCCTAVVALLAGCSSASVLPTETAEPSPTTIPATATPAPTATETGPWPLFPVFSQEPVVPHGPQGRWDGRFMDPGAVVVAGGKFHMFHNGFPSWPAEVGVIHSVSDDGLHWQRVQEDWVFNQEGVEYAGLTLLAASALVEDDGTWVLYFYTWDSRSTNASAKIGRATAPGPDGPWQADPAPALQPGPEGAWDDNAVISPSVVKTDDGYRMYYVGSRNSPRSKQIGLATSADGISWVKVDDPSTEDPLFAESDPVLVPVEQSGQFDSRFMAHVNVVYADEGWLMEYRGDAGINDRLGLARSEDGIHWQRYPQNPVFGPDAFTGGNAIWFSELVHQGDRYFLYVELGKGSTTEVYAATHNGRLFEDGP
ncbi:MAG: hypothetical protein WBR18_03050 [Anaerolineales bacterium]